MSSMPRKKKEGFRRSETKPEMEWRPSQSWEAEAVPQELTEIFLTLTASPSPRLVVESANEDDLSSVRYREQRGGELLVWYLCRECRTVAFTNLGWEGQALLRIYHADYCPSRPG